MDRSTPADAAFAEVLQGLPRETFEAFVAGIWRARGWAVGRDGGCLELDREGPPPERWRLAVAHDPAETDLDREVVDVLVTSRPERPQTGPEAGTDVLSAPDLLEILRYGLDRETADRLVTDHLDRDISAFVPDKAATGACDVPDGTSAGGPDHPRKGTPSGRNGTGTEPAITAVVLLVLVAAVAGGTTVEPLIDSGHPNVPTPGPAASGATPDPTPEPVPTATTASTTPGEGARETAGQTRYFTIEPTCERPPELVLAIVLGALAANDPSTDAGIEAASRFSALPKTEEGFGFPPILNQPEYALLFTHETATYGPTRPLSRSVVSIRARLENATASRTYRFVLSNEESWDSLGCWRLSGVLLEDDGAVSLRD